MCPIPKELQGFIVDDGMCNCWGDADYEPPEELDHLMIERKREQPQEEDTELEDFEIPTPRRAKSFQQRLAEKKTRAKRLAMAKEAHRWYTNQGPPNAQVAPVWSSSPTSHSRKKKIAPPAKISPLRFKFTTTERQKRDTNRTTRCDDFLQYGSNRRGASSSSPNRFTTPIKSKDTDTMSVRSIMSSITRQRMLDALEWDSE